MFPTLTDRYRGMEITEAIANRRIDGRIAAKALRRRQLAKPIRQDRG